MLGVVAEKIEGVFKSLESKVGASGLPMIAAARVAAGLVLGIAGELLRGVIASGEFVGYVNKSREFAKGLVEKLVPGPLRWIPFFRPSRFVDRLADWLIDHEDELAASVGAKAPE